MNTWHQIFTLIVHFTWLGQFISKSLVFDIIVLEKVKYVHDLAENILQTKILINGSSSLLSFINEGNHINL